MVILIVILHVIACIFLISVILLQAGRGQGLSWGVFGGTPQSILGTKTASFLSRVTTGCAIIFLFSCIFLNIIETRKSRSLLIGPQQPISQLDFSKIKKALEEAEKAKGTTGVTATPQKPAEVLSEAVKAAVKSEIPPPSVATPAVPPATPQEKSTLPIGKVPPPPEKK